MAPRGTDSSPDESRSATTVARIPRDLADVMKAVKPSDMSLQAYHANLLAGSLWNNPDARKLLQEQGWKRQQTTVRRP